ncbi:MAG: hypothetical protein ACREF3_20980 [Acetobacteraceae bacterium]
MPRTWIATSRFAVLAMTVAVLFLCHAACAADVAETAATTCLDGVSALYSQHQFTEAADKYVCAADALEKDPNHAERAARYRANAWLYRSCGTYTQKPITGPLGRENLADAIRQAQQSLPLWQAAQFPAGERLAQAWLTYLDGVRLGVAGQYTAARAAFDQAREQFTRIGEDIPPLREFTDMLLGLAEDQTVFSEVMNAMNDPASFQSQGGAVNERLADMQRRATPETRPYYASLAALFRMERQFFEAGDRLEAWDYRDAASVLAQARAALRAAQSGADATPGAATSAAYRSVLAGWSSVLDAEDHHAAALKALLADGDMAIARNELLGGVAAYRQAQAAFETAGYPPGTMVAIEKTYARLRDQAAAVAAAFGPTQAMLAVGRTFLVVFIIVLGVLTALRRRIPLNPALTIWAALVVSIIGTFGLRATELLQAINLGSMPK